MYLNALFIATICFGLLDREPQFCARMDAMAFQEAEGGFGRRDAGSCIGFHAVLHPRTDRSNRILLHLVAGRSNLAGRGFS